MFKLLENEELQRMVDYSFGDQSGVLGHVPNAYMKKANIYNREFVNAVDNHKGEVMTLFIDNIRLYKREINYSDWLHLKPISEVDRSWLSQFHDEDLLNLCSFFIDKKFIIFTAFEDTPLDTKIWFRIPPNVVSINAANGVVFGDKVRPFPHGIERKMYEGYNHHELLEKYMTTKFGAVPKNKLLVCHRDDTGERGDIKDLFRDKEWATVADHLEYEDYLQAIQDHRFVLCPSGNGIESARNWETLYLGRTPIFKRHRYLEEMFKDLSALFVDDFSEVTEEFLDKNKHVWVNWFWKGDRDKLDLNYWFNKALQ